MNIQLLLNKSGEKARFRTKGKINKPRIRTSIRRDQRIVKTSHGIERIIQKKISHPLLKGIILSTAATSISVAVEMAGLTAGVPGLGTILFGGLMGYGIAKLHENDANYKMSVGTKTVYTGLGIIAPIVNPYTVEGVRGIFTKKK